MSFNTIFRLSVSLCLIAMLSGCPTGGGGGGTTEDPGQGTQWDQMKWDQGKWG